MDWRPHIVVVEDEAAGRQLLIGYLSKRGYRVTGFASGVGLRRMVEREIPNLVLLDIGLPGEDGLALARWLREKSSKICIIMVTAAGETVDRIVGLESPSPSSPASCWPASRACCAAPARRRQPRPASGSAWAGASSISNAIS
jgi:CheY-like chemotaxis protein